MAVTAFFAKLPVGRLTPPEAELRDLLLRTARAAERFLTKGGAVSLQQWAERRIPGEVVLGTDAAGRVTIRPAERAPEPKGPALAALPTPKAKASPPVADEAGGDPKSFFSRLPADSFTQEEEELRAALTGLLAQRPQPVAQLMKDSQVRSLTKSFLPSGVPLRDWVEGRIGGEVLVEDDGRGPVLRLAPGSKEELRESFFAGLPAGSFTREEEDLRSALFDFLATWKSQELANLSHAGSDKAVQQARIKLLPAGVPLKDWIERRIGGEVELKPDRKGQFVVHLTPVARPLVSQRFQELEGGSPSVSRESRVFSKVPPGDEIRPAGPDLRRDAEKRTKGERRESLPPSRAPAEPDPLHDGEKVTKATKREAFFAELPPDGFTKQEEVLREAILAFLAQWTGEDAPTLTNAGSDPAVRAARAALMPKASGVSLREWIDRRIGGEVETSPDNNSGGLQVTFGLRGQFDPARSTRKRRADGSSKGPGAGGKGGKASGSIIGMDPGQGAPWKKGR